MIGSLLSTTLQPLLHSSGGTIALLCIWAAGLTLFTGWSWVSIAEKLGGGILSVLTFASNRTRRDDTWVDEGEYEDDEEEYDDEEAARPQESRRARILRSALARRKRLAEKFTNPMGRKTDAALSPANGWMTRRGGAIQRQRGACCRRRCTVFRRQRRASRRG
ncbi:cell division protein [Klebsiella pneumoniae]|uniref:Cell division protein n=1 Tax=Klebsiella pneumoniae TaxID=573 RepID=A0A2X1QTB8_KLEPN|nr:cell division protein [Klebsiella pneumoniae]